MIAHVVLFTPKATLSAAERASFVDVLDTALTSIPGIARVRVGRHVGTPRHDERLGPQHEFVAILEFASIEALEQYLEHPAHAALAEAFYRSLDHAVVSDFEVVSDVRALKV